MEQQQHPSFVRAAALAEPLRSHFPKSREEASAFVPMTPFVALSARVLVVAKTRVECAWCAYCDAVPGVDHRSEIGPILRHGAKVEESLARLLFPEFADVPYA